MSILVPMMECRENDAVARLMHINMPHAVIEWLSLDAGLHASTDAGIHAWNVTAGRFHGHLKAA